MREEAQRPDARGLIADIFIHGPSSQYCAIAGAGWVMPTPLWEDWDVLASKGDEKGADCSRLEER